VTIAPGVTLRERKKDETRTRIAAAGRRLFATHGFERITVARIAAEAGVSAKTVFNYFPAKEGIFFAGRSPVEPGLLPAVCGRGEGESAYDAVRRFATRPATVTQAVRERSPGETVYDAIQRFQATGPAPVGVEVPDRETYARSPTLQAYVREEFAAQELALADLLRADAGSGPTDPVPTTVAAALLAPLRWRFMAALAGWPAAVGAAYDLLAPALADYARRS